jgi:hypothetical protein
VSKNNALVESMKQEEDASKASLAKLRENLEVEYQNRLDNIEARNLAQQKKKLESQKISLTKKSEAEIEAITEQKVKAEREEQELSKKVAESEE